MEPDVVVRLVGDFGEQVDCVSLKSGDVRVGIQRVYPTSGVPARPGGEHAPLHDGNVGPSQLRQVVENAGTDNASPDDNHPILALHPGSFDQLSVNLTKPVVGVPQTACAVRRDMYHLADLTSSANQERTFEL